MAKRLRIYHSPKYTIALPEKHRFPMERYDVTFNTAKERLSHQPIFEILHPPPIPTPKLLLAHSSDFVTRFFQGSLTHREIRDIGFPWSQALVERTRLIMGGSLQATDDLLCNANRRGFTVAGNLAGGFHHAFTSHGEGFCIFNDIAVSCFHALEQHPDIIKRILVIDLDVHQGNGTAEICRRRSNNQVFTFSMHGKHNYPFDKEVSDYDVELDDNTGDEAYLSNLEFALDRVFDLCRNPDMVVYQAGVDPLQGDRWGKLALTREGLQQRNRLVFQHCKERDIPVLCLMGGGYSRDIQESADAHVDVYQNAAEFLQRSI